jgi:ribosomal protein L11 methyltransferase
LTTGEWVFEATCDALPDLTAFESLAKTTLGGAVDFAIAAIDPEMNWVAKSLEGLKPVIAGGFYVHGGHDAGAAPAGLIDIHIDAAEAFGTGHHETTTGCLEAIDRTLKRSKPRHMLDVGTGTGVLAIALARRTHLNVIASDIDPIATRTAAENAHLNGVGRQVIAVTAPGLDHPLIAKSAPYDLIVANILAGPLMELSESFAAAIRPGGRVLLSGLLVEQADMIVSTYKRRGFEPERQIDLETGGAWWRTLLLQRTS